MWYGKHKNLMLTFTQLSAAVTPSRWGARGLPSAWAACTHTHPWAPGSRCSLARGLCLNLHTWRPRHRGWEEEAVGVGVQVQVVVVEEELREGDTTAARRLRIQPT